MDTERHVEIDETHAEPEAEGGAEAAVSQTVAAEAAVALAGATAAAAELDAAERVRRFEVENEEWRNSLQESVNSLSTSLETLRSVELNEMQTERRVLTENLLALSGRMEELESRLSNPPPSTPQEEPQASPLLGGEAEIAAGPIEAEAGASLAGSEDHPGTSQNANATRRRRWI